MKKFITVVGILCIAAAPVMYSIGSTNSHLTELKDFFYLPLIAGVVLLIAVKCGCKKCGCDKQ